MKPSKYEMADTPGMRAAKALLQAGNLSGAALIREVAAIIDREIKAHT